MRTIWLGSKIFQQYSLKDIQEKLKISKVTALKLVNSDELKAQKSGRQWWINEDDFIAFLQGESKR